MTVIFGGVTLMLSDDFYIKLKAILLNIIFSGAFLLPLFWQERKPLIKRLFIRYLRTYHAGWINLNFAWAAMFALMSFACFFAFLFMDGKYWENFGW